jgi:L-threonylcarbamoyladenylate synthase
VKTRVAIALGDAIARVMDKVSTISNAQRILRDGGLVAFPTETVYGLGADATNDQAVARIFAAKGRPQFNPLISHVSTVEQALQLGQFSADAEKLAQAIWPGPLTIVVERRPDCPISLLCSAGLSTVALRVPNHPLALDLLRAVDRPIAAPSANPSGQLSPTTADHVRQSLGSKVDLVLDGGPSSVGVESTVVRFVDAGPYLLRSGGVTRETIDNALGRRVMTPTRFNAELHSPGLLESHYAPHAAMRLNAAMPETHESYLGFGPYDYGPYSLSSSGDLNEAAANLFKMLHEIDRAKPEVIAVAPIPEMGLGEAINDRLRRAAAPRPVP